MSVSIDKTHHHTHHFNTAIWLVKRQQYPQAADRFKTLLEQNKKYFPDVMIFLLKQLRSRPGDMFLRMHISEIYTAHEYIEDAILELEDAFEQDPTYSHTFF